MRTDVDRGRFGLMLCASAAAVIIAALVPAPASASTEAGCVGAARKVEPNGADAICVQGADYITVHITCVDVNTASEYDRDGPRSWSNARDPMIGGSRYYCDFPGDPIKSWSFTVG
jgi:hypothetical protein